MAKYKEVISWPYFWANRVASCVIVQGAKANIVLTLTKPMFGFVATDFTVVKVSTADTVNSISTSTDGLVITIIVASAFALNNAGTLTLTKHSVAHTMAINNQITS